MAVHHKTLTLDGTVQQLTTDSIVCTEVQLQGESGGAAIYVGSIVGPTVSGASPSAVTLSATDYGQVIAATSVTPLIMRSGSGFVNLNSIYVLGTNANKLHILYTKK